MNFYISFSQLNREALINYVIDVIIISKIDRITSFMVRSFME